jgi:hypothetical protein
MSRHDQAHRDDMPLGQTHTARPVIDQIYAEVPAEARDPFWAGNAVEFFKRAEHSRSQARGQRYGWYV